MYTALKQNPAPTTAEITKKCDGNLCRCTGYRPIIDAAKSLSVDMKDQVSPLTKKNFTPYDPLKDPKFPGELKEYQRSPLHFKGERSEWFTPLNLSQLLKLKQQHPEAKLVNGNTELGIDIRYKNAHFPVFISPVHVPELNVFKVGEKGIEIGAAVTLTRIFETLEHLKKDLPPNEKHKERPLNAIIDQLHWFAGTPIRNVSSIGGNIVNASPISDLNPVWIALNATFKLRSEKGERVVKASDFFISYKRVDIQPDEVLVSLDFPWNEPNEYIEAYKQSRRREDDIAIVTACISMKIGENNEIQNAIFAYGGLGPTPLTCPETSEFLIGKQITEKLFSKTFLTKLAEEVKLPEDPPGGMSEYRTTLALSFAYKFFLSVAIKKSSQNSPRY